MQRGDKTRWINSFVSLAISRCIETLHACALEQYSVYNKKKITFDLSANLVYKAVTSTKSAYLALS